MRIYLLAMFCVNAQVYSARVLTLDTKEQIIDTPIYDENIILADSVNKNGKNLGDLMEIINEENIPINNEIGGVLETYLKPISKLSELFPNQQVELQLEIDGSNYIPKRYLRHSDTTVLPSSYTIITTPTQLETSTNSAVKDRPVYMSDLKKVFDDFEKKHTKQGANGQEAHLKLSDTTAHGHCKKDRDCGAFKIELHDDIKQVPFVNIKQTVGNLNDLLGLLRKGVQVEKGIGKPTGENMSWFQIKIPRN